MVVTKKNNRLKTKHLEKIKIKIQKHPNQQIYQMKKNQKWLKLFLKYYIP
jgi:hypothetical protein